MLFFRKRNDSWFEGSRVKDIPNIIDDRKIYVVGQGKYKWVAILKCPCGCDQIIHLNLLKEGKSVWTVVVHRDKTVTVRPSIWRTVGCKSHFTIRRGYLDWVNDDFLIR